MQSGSIRYLEVARERWRRIENMLENINKKKEGEWWCVRCKKIVAVDHVCFT